MRTPPCGKGETACTERTPGCQAHCEKYKAWRAEWDHAKEKRLAEHDVNQAMRDGNRRLARLKSQAAKSILEGSKR